MQKFLNLFPSEKNEKLERENNHILSPSLEGHLEKIPLPNMLVVYKGGGNSPSDIHN